MVSIYGESLGAAVEDEVCKCQSAYQGLKVPNSEYSIWDMKPFCVGTWIGF